jgi:type IX secretion system PorP/SprF family membrane protein
MILKGSSIFSQQSTLFNTYSLDPLLLNIAYAGSSCNEVNAHYRTQWIGMANAPKAMQLNAHSAFRKNNGIAFRVNSQTIGLVDKLNVTLGYTYIIKISKYSKVHFGIGIGWDQTQFNSNKAIVLSSKDVNLNNLNQQKANGIDSEFGMLAIGKKSKIGFSVLHLFNSNPEFSGNGSFKTLPQINLQGSYVFNKDKKVEIEPWVLNRFTLRGNNVLEGMINFKLENSLSIGAGYRNNYGIIFLASYKIDNFRIAYSVDYGTNKNAINLGSSHQIMIGYSICKTVSKLGFNGKSRKLLGDKETQKEKGNQSDTIVNSITQTETKSNTDTLISFKNQNEDTLLKKIKENKEVISKYEILPNLNQVAETPKTDSSLVTNEIVIINQVSENKTADSTLSTIAQKKSENNKLSENDSPTIKSSVSEPAVIKEAVAVESPTIVIAEEVISKTEKDSLPIKSNVSEPAVIKEAVAVESSTTAIAEEVISKTEKDSLPKITSVSEPEEIKKSSITEAQKQLVSQINAISEEVIFKLNDAKLGKDMLKKLDDIANIIKADPELKINIIGHTCNRGTKQYNDVLSSQRADYIKRELLKRGVKKRNFKKTIGVGYNDSLFDNSAKNQKKNRTIRFDLVK